MDEFGKRVTVAIRIRPKIMSATNATQTAERFHPDACTKIGDSTIRLADTSSVMGSSQNDSATSNIGSKEGRMNSFSFDYVFDQDSSQLEVYEDTALDAVDSALSAGCNATIMTYGQTGSGKTYTVLGAVGNNPLSNEVVTPDTGLFLRVLKDVLSYAEARADQIHIVVGLTVTEVYLDTVRDLLAPLASSNAEPPTLRVVIVDENTRIPDVTNKPISQVRDAVACYRTATNRRVCRATEANDQSSRSHAIFSIDIYQQRRFPDINPEPLSLEELCQLRDNTPAPKAKPKAAAAAPSTPLAANKSNTSEPSTPTVAGSPAAPAAAVDPRTATPFDMALASNPLIRVGNGHPPVVLSKIVLTDLAGSEKLKHSKAKGEALEEMKKINGSLTALGNVVHALFSSSKHVPYRDSKLTVLLRSTFATPNSRIVLIANCAPTALTFDETLSTMFFADKVKAMKVDDATGASAARAAAALQLEADKLRLSKEYEDLAAEMRILRQGYFEHRPCIRASLFVDLASNPEAAAIFHPEVRARVPVAPLPKVAKALIKAAEEKCFVTIEARKAAEAAAWAATLVKEEKDLCENTIANYHSAVQRAHASMKSNDAETKQALKELDETQTIIQQEITETEPLTEQLAQTNVDLKPIRKALPKQLRTVYAEDNSLTQQVEEMERAFMEKYKDQQDAWDAATKQFNDREALHDIEGGFFDKYAEYLNLRADYFTEASAVEVVRVEARDAERESEAYDVAQWIKRALNVMANNAVIRSHNALRAQTGGNAGMARNGSGHGNGSSSSLHAAAPRVPSSRHIDPESGRLRKRANTPFDQAALLKQVRSYMETGCTLLMYGRKGSPHFRFFFLETEELPEGVDPDQPYQSTFMPKLYWCKDDTERMSSDIADSCIDLSVVTHVTIGKTPGLFPEGSRTAADIQKQPATADDDYYTSFAIHYLRDGRDKEPKTVCITTESKAEMEAWVIGVCNVCGVNPEFGEKMPLADLTAKAGLNDPHPSQAPKEGTQVVASPTNKPSPLNKSICGEDGTPLSRALLERPQFQHLAPYCSTDVEVRLCEEWHVPPRVWLSCKVRLQGMNNKLGHPIMLTPGEVRQMFPQLDIFRANAAWGVLAQIGLLERAPDSISYLSFDQ